MLPLSIFISSPKDVAEERDKALNVIESLERVYAGDLQFTRLKWEEMPLSAARPFQPEIDAVVEHANVDIAIFIFWSRMGTPVTVNGISYSSGTEREFRMMLKACEESDRRRPLILVYFREDEHGLVEMQNAGKLEPPSDKNLHKSLRQRLKLEEFKKEFNVELPARAGGSLYGEEEKVSGEPVVENRRAYTKYGDPVEFKALLRLHLKGFVGQKLAEAGIRAVQWEGNPYRSFETFDVQHSRVFFGREDAVFDLQTTIRNRRQCHFAVVIGASGSGKSSLVRAGLAAYLLTTDDDESVLNWRRAEILPGQRRGAVIPWLAEQLQAGGSAPRDATIIEWMVERLRANGAVQELDAVVEPADLASRLQPGSPDVADVRKALTMGSEIIPENKTTGKPETARRLMLLLIVDQLEELYTDKTISPAERKAFYRALHALACTGYVWVVATLRSDFYGEAQKDDEFLDLKGKKNEGLFDLLSPRTSELRDLIVKPASMAGVSFEKDHRNVSLDQLLLDEANSQDCLPLLEFALHELFEKRDLTKRIMTFEALGKEGLNGVLQRRAERVLNALSDEANGQFSFVMRQVTTVTENGKFTRRWARREELERRKGARELVEAFLDQKARLFVVKGEDDGNQSGAALISVAHEALLTIWEELRSELEKSRDFLKLRSRITEDATEWRKTQPWEFRYLAGRQLQDALNYFKDDVFEALECDFIVASSVRAQLEMNEVEDWEKLTKDASIFKHKQADRWPKFLQQALQSTSATIRRNACLLLGRLPVDENSDLLAEQLINDDDALVRRKAAESMLRLDSEDVYQKLLEESFTPNKTRSAMAGLTRLLALADLSIEAQTFDRWYSRQPKSKRAQVRVASWVLRLRESLAYFFVITCTGTALGVTAAMLWKALPGGLNWAYGQEIPSISTALFHGAAAGVLILVPTIAGLTFYRMVLGREHGTFHSFRPFGSIVAGVLFGLIGGLAMTSAVAGVFSTNALYIMGWMEDRYMPSIGNFLYQLFWVNCAGIPFTLNGVGTGVGMAVLSNRMRGVKQWKNFLDEQEPGSLTDFKKARNVLWTIIRIAFPYSWRIAICLAVTTTLGLFILEQRGHAPMPPSLHECLFGGMEPEPAMATGRSGNAKAEAKPANEGRQDWEEKIRMWKRSMPGRCIGIGFDAGAKMLAAFFGVIGIGFGIVILRSGVSIEARSLSNGRKTR